MNKNDKIFVAGHNGLVGNAILNALKKKSFKNIITLSKKKLDLTNHRQVNLFFRNKKIDILFICAAKVGGIKSNSKYPYEFISINNNIQHNLFNAVKNFNIKKTMFMGSSCIFPKNSRNPIKEEYLLTNTLEKTNEAYALSKIVGLKTAEYLIKEYKKDIRCFMPCNLFGYKDKFFDIGNNHVIPALIHKFHNAREKKHKKIFIWGDGSPKREFMHADDLAENIINLMKLNKNIFFKNIGKEFFYNIGTNHEISIKSLCKLIKKMTNCKSELVFDKSMPNGTLRKFMSKAKLESFYKIKNGNFEKLLEETVLHYENLRSKKF